MYYEEQIIDGVLCYRHHVKAEWKEFSKGQLTKLYCDLRQEVIQATELLQKGMDNLLWIEYSDRRIFRI